MQHDRGAAEALTWVGPGGLVESGPHGPAPTAIVQPAWDPTTANTRCPGCSADRMNALDPLPSRSSWAPPSAGAGWPCCTRHYRQVKQCYPGQFAHVEHSSRLQREWWMQFTEPSVGAGMSCAVGRSGPRGPPIAVPAACARCAGARVWAPAARADGQRTLPLPTCPLCSSPMSFRFRPTFRRRRRSRSGSPPRHRRWRGRLRRCVYALPRSRRSLSLGLWPGRAGPSPRAAQVKPTGACAARSCSEAASVSYEGVRALPPQCTRQDARAPDWHSRSLPSALFATKACPRDRAVRSR